VGQPELESLLARHELRQLRQRIVLRFRLRPFDAAETASYVEERLRLAGYTGKDLFRRPALKRLYEVTGGVPRLINVVCDGVLLTGYSRDLDSFDAAIVDEVAQDLGLLSAPGPDVRSGSEVPAPHEGHRRRGWRGRLRGLFR